MKKTRKFNILVAMVLALTMIMPTTMTAYAADNEAYVYQFENSVGYSNNDVEYADGSGSAYAYLIYTSGPEGKQQYGGYCADFETSLDEKAYYSRTTLGESGHFSDSVTGHLRAILANSVPVKDYLDVAAAAGVTEVSQGEVVAATQWAIWAHTNSSSAKIAAPSKDGTTAKEKVAYYLYNLPPISSGYATEPVLMNITAYQDGSKMIFDYSGSVNIGALYNKVVTVTDGAGNALPYTDENYKVIVDVSGLNSDQTVTVNIDGQQTLAADAYFYNPQGGRAASQSLVSWFEGVTSVAGSASGTYEVEKEQVQLVLTGDKELTGRQIDTAVDNFQFVVKAADTGDIAATGTADKNGKITFSPIVYTKAQAGSEFNYNVTETAGTNPGMEYDTAVKTVTVKVYYENGQVKTSVTHGDEGGIAFVNKYTAKDAEMQLSVEKKLDGKALQEGQFQFTKVKCDANGVPLEGAEPETVTNKADGSVVFAAESYSKEGVHYYLIQEVNGGQRIEGVTYDNMNIVVKVTVTDNKLGQLVAAAEYPRDATFDNKYTADAVEVVLEGQKFLKGRTLADGEFTFVLKDQSGKEVGKSVNGKDGKFAFAPLVFKAPGEYTYTISEVNAGADGVTYDKAVHAVKVKVTDNGKGKLVAEASYPEGGAVFHNTYKGQGQIEVTKHFRLNDAAEASDLKFEVGVFTDEALTVKAVRADGSMVENKVINMNQQASASVTFDGLEYGTYYVAEIGNDGKPLAEGVVTGKLDGAAYRQTVAYDNEKAVLTINDKQDAVQITNDFYTEEYWLQGTIKVNKQVKSDGEVINVNAKYFVALFADPEMTKLASEVKFIEMNEKDMASVTFDKLEINKTYYVAETDLQGKPLKAGDYRISNIKVENGAIEILPGSGSAAHESVITNEYVTEADEVQLKVMKRLDGKELQEGQFQFTMVECNADGVPLDGAAVETAVNKADGTVEFAKKTYKKEGVHFYLIKESGGGNTVDGVTYDDMQVIVKVTVDFTEPGKLTATEEYPADVTFDNKYVADPVDAVIEGQKVLEGRNLMDGEFAFVLKDAAGNEIGTAVNNAEGGFAFEPVTFEKAGEFVYTVEERNDAAGGVTYDQTIHTVTVKVTDNGKGKLVAEIVYPEGGVVFNNTYEGTDAIKVTKQVQIFGEVVKVDAKYFVALFADPELTQLASEVKAIEMNGQETSSVVFENLEINKTYYVAETTSMGLPLEDGTYNIARITVVDRAVDVLPGMTEIPEVMIINEYDSDEFDYFDEDEEEEDVEYYEEVIEETDKAVQTGDDFNPAIVGFAMAAALLAMLGAAVLRKRESEDK